MYVCINIPTDLRVFFRNKTHKLLFNILYIKVFNQIC